MFLPTFMMIGQKLENCHYIHLEKNAPSTGSHSETSIETMKTAPPTDGHVFQRIGTTFEINHNIIKTNILTNYMKIGHEIFELGRDFIGIKLLIKFHEDGTRNQMLTDGRTKTGHKSSPEQSALPRYGSGHKSDRRTDSRTDNAKTISLRLWQGIYTHTKFQ
ncbi:hypothetical protein DPMN_151998 [Dreissena polymorpha]|uniref:Uncharacterized protein n=1 Tax=Dreissena polymorpha TaxID=45954 RepID=A0A9D4FG30_DREPO|nr:hypothetical protein DPMN_151998 [Dreissena polymorpha]